METQCSICNVFFQTANPRKKMCGKRACELKYKRLVEKKRYLRKHHERRLIEIDGLFYFDRGYMKTRAIKVKCENCGKEYFLDVHKMKRSKMRLCSPKCRIAIYKDVLKQRIGNKNPGWKGGHYHDGYKIVESRQFEHRVIMEKQIGRKLMKSEIVHHKDLNRSNNYPSNLRLFKNTSEHHLFHAQLTREALKLIKRNFPEKYIRLIEGEWDEL